MNLRTKIFKDLIEEQLASIQPRHSPAALTAGTLRACQVAPGLFYLSMGPEGSAQGWVQQSLPALGSGFERGPDLKSSQGAPA